MLHASPDLDHLRTIATNARDGHRCLGVRIPPTPLVTIATEHLLVLLDATTEPAVHHVAHIRQLGDHAGLLNAALADNDTAAIRAHAGRIARLAHQLQEDLNR